MNDAEKIEIQEFIIRTVFCRPIAKINQKTDPSNQIQYERILKPLKLYESVSL